MPIDREKVRELARKVTPGPFRSPSRSARVVGKNGVTICYCGDNSVYAEGRSYAIGKAEAQNNAALFAQFSPENALDVVARLDMLDEAMALLEKADWYLGECGLHGQLDALQERYKNVNG